ncbi:MAG: LON peptidase substrate-binding domain-containing protein, partial [Myxococcota bacterium]|nr:LON peptidase substrate-binding domain-containing protein [Myxococcota bacterium]
MQPILPLPKEILLPEQIVELQIQSPIGTAAIEYHIQSGQSLVVVPQQKDTLYPAADDLFHIGCTGRVLRSVSSQS